MSCCGNKRAAFAQQQAAGGGTRTVNIAGQAPGSGGRSLTRVTPKMWSDWHFENTGEPAVTLHGAVTGKHYHWAHKGDVQAVDYRDAGPLGQYQAVLKRVR